MHYIILLHLTSGAEVVRILHTSNCMVFQVMSKVMSNAVSMIPWGSIWFHMVPCVKWCSMVHVMATRCLPERRLSRKLPDCWTNVDRVVSKTVPETVKHGETIRLVWHGLTSPVTSAEKKTTIAAHKHGDLYKKISRISNKHTLTQTHCLNVDIELLML